MKYSESFIQNILLTSTSGSPFSLKRNYNLLTIFNVSWGFFKEGEADILTVTNNYELIEGEIKCTFYDFLSDDKKKPEIMEERKRKLARKYYIIPIEIYREHENEIFEKLCERKCGLVLVNGTSCNTIYPAPDFDNDYTIDLNQFFKLVKLTCYRQNRLDFNDVLEFKEYIGDFMDFNKIIEEVKENKKEINYNEKPKDWQELCKMFKEKFKGTIQIIDKYTRAGFDGKQAIFIQTMKSGEGLLFCENGYVLDTIKRSIIAMLNVQQIWEIIKILNRK